MRNRIWSELSQTKFGDIYLRMYLDRQKSIRRWYKGLTVVFSTGGVLGWGVWEYAPAIACGLIAVLQIVTLLESHLIMSDSTIEATSKLRRQYVEKYNALEELWFAHTTGRIDDAQTADKFFEIQKTNADTESMDDKLDVKNNSRLYKKADIEMNEYLKVLNPQS